MAIHALTSVAGAPGVTTLSIAWAYESPRPTLILEADTKGGSDILAGLWDGQQKHERSVLSLIQRDPGEFPDLMMELAYPLPGRDDRWVLPTIGAPVQATTMAPMWLDIASAARELSTRGIDVVVDLGRYRQSGFARPLLDYADTLLVLVTANLQNINTTHISMAALGRELTRAGSAERLTVVPVVGGKNADRCRPYSVADMRPYVAPAPILATLPYAPAAAAIYSNAQPRRRGLRQRLLGLGAENSYTNSVRSVLEAAHARRESLEADLAGRSTP